MKKNNEEVVIIDAEWSEVVGESIENARQAGVPEENIIKSEEELDAFMNGEQLALDIDTVLEDTKEEETMTKQQFDKEALVKTLIASGVEESIARATAENVAKQKAEEAAKVEEPKQEQPVQENKMVNPKPWFKEAVKGLGLPRKVALIGELTIQQIKSKSDADKAAIKKEIELLESDKGDERFETLMNGYIINAKGWTITESGKLAEFAYLTGDGVQKGVSGVTRTVGKATRWTGEKIAKGGQAMENNAEQTGKIARKPFDMVGKGFDKMSKKK